MYRYGNASNQTAFRSDRPLSNDQLARYAPSVLASEAHEARGERYAFIPTLQVLDGLRSEGFEPYEVRQTRCRDQGKREFTKHLVRLRHASQITTKEEFPEIILINSHDGTSSYQLLSGLFRFVCSNGLIAGDVCDDIRLRHSGNVVNNVIEGSFQVLDNLKQVGERLDTYKAITLSDPEAYAFGEAAAELRWDRNEAGALPVSASSVVAPRRFEDRKNDLWTVFNRTQENLVKGGISARTTTGKRTHTREVGGVTENVKLNRALWTLADRLASIKQGA